MHKSVEIVLRGIPRTGALERYIGEQARSLDRLCDRLLSCHVVAEALYRSRQHGAQFTVRLNITLPGTEVVVNSEHGEDVYIAMRDAFEAAGLQLRDHMRRKSDTGPRSHNGSTTPRR